MYSGIKEKINKIKKISNDEKIELKESINYHHTSIGNFIHNNPNLPIAILNALEDRQIDLSDAQSKL